ncbi:MAG: hypothetical protein ABI680_15685 [Chthoniobacteraceae bacterium]
MTTPDRAAALRSTRLEFLFAVVCGVGVLAFIIYGVMTMGSRQEAANTNTLTGEVVAKNFVPAPEQQVTFGAKGVKSRQIAGEYVLEVRVASEQRTFHVPVDRITYEAAKIGDRQTFLRPPSEQSR